MGYIVVMARMGRVVCEEVVVLIKQAIGNQKGLYDWVMQRISALFLTAYIVPLLVFWIMGDAKQGYHAWQLFLLSPVMKILGAFAAIGLFVHAVIGAWIVATDYIKPPRLQTGVLALVNLIIFVSSISLLIILWRFN